MVCGHLPARAPTAQGAQPVLLQLPRQRVLRARPSTVCQAPAPVVGASAPASFRAAVLPVIFLLCPKHLLDLRRSVWSSSTGRHGTLCCWALWALHAEKAQRARRQHVHAHMTDLLLMTHTGRQGAPAAVPVCLMGERQLKNAGGVQPRNAAGTEECSLGIA